MFDLSWFWLYFILWYHVKSVIFSLYMHRGIGHRQLFFSNKMSHFCRFILWISNKTGPMYAETYYIRHTDHHRYADTTKDPHSPFHMSVKQMIAPWGYPAEILEKSPVKTPTDWIQRNIYDRYSHQGRWIEFLIAGALFGPLGFVIAWIIDVITEPWMGILVGNWMFHKVGFTYEKNKNKQIKARNLLPFGIMLAGEELHANHHNDPNRVNYAKRWWEFDIGYAYAVILKQFGCITFNKNAVKKKRK